MLIKEGIDLGIGEQLLTDSDEEDEYEQITKTRKENKDDDKSLDSFRSSNFSAANSA